MTGKNRVRDEGRLAAIADPLDLQFELPLKARGTNLPNMPLSSAGRAHTDLYARIDRHLRGLLHNHRPAPLSHDLEARLYAIREQFDQSHSLPR